MQRQSFYINQSGTLKRKNNTVWFENEKEKKALPINNIDTLYCMGETTINTKLLTYLSKQGIIIHFFNYYGYYTGSFYPKESLVSGSLLVNQVKYYIDNEKRTFIAKQFIKASLFNLVRLLEHYRKHSKNVKETMEKIEKFALRLDNINTIVEIMNLEGMAWQEYYKTFREIVTNDFEFDKRTKRPPENEINCLISFLNSMLYTSVLSEIYHTQLNPTISYLHEPFERRFSLALDLSEMFKPLIVQRAILKLVNKKEIKGHHFRKELKGCLLNENGRRLVIKEFDNRLRLTIEHPELKRRVSHRRLIRIECYKLIKHLLGEKQYEAFRMWW
ncbi:type I-B CRISPR-associated endonuclease Cas1 [Candidatus Woesearchaeota archaeon]|nr:type I-B CRISPR-associated endonuclease Cas1 [Candidatus Woesearchaeota archaeon]